MTTHLCRGWLLGALLLGLAGGRGQRADCQDNSQLAQADEKRRGEELQKQIYDALAKHGGIDHPDCPYVVRVKHVAGRKLRFVQFLHRDPSGKGYDLVGLALEAELKGVDLGKRQILVRTWHTRLQTPDASGYVLMKVWVLDLPKDLGFLKAAAPKGRAAPAEGLSPEQRRFLAAGFAPLSVQKKLEQAFGRECDELFRKEQHYYRGYGVVLAADKIRPESDRRRVVLPSCSIGRPGKEPGAIIRGQDVSLSVEDYCELMNDPDGSHPITLECPGGKRIVLRPH
jgi:hypothetical protein